MRYILNVLLPMFFIEGRGEYKKKIHSGVEERYLGRLKRARRVEMLYGTLAKFGETFAHDAWQYRAKPTVMWEGVETRW